MRGDKSIKVTLFLLWILYVDALYIGNENDTEFEPITTRPLKYLPQPRIVGGQNARNNQFPYQISLRLNNYHICGGSIISKNFVITAAHCVTTDSGGTVTRIPADRLTVRAGSVEVNSGGIILPVTEVKVHPNYRNFNNDIAVLKLSRSLRFSDDVKAISLAAQMPKQGVDVITSGWGRLRNGGATPNILQFNTLKVISNAECRRRIGNVPTSILCLSHTIGNGVCNGDSGGPAVYDNQLVGVTNFVIGGCGSSAPDGYANVVFFYNWILNNTDLK